MDDEDVARLRIAMARILRFVDRQVRGDAMTRTQMSVLGTVARLGPIGLSDLAEIEGVNPTMLSRIVGKLETAELLHRLRDPEDHRAVQVEVTETGRVLQQRLRRERTQLLVDRIAELPADRAAELTAALPALEMLASEMTRNRPVAASR
jgi:DNA-binding MarR family transcriptional regulator